MEKIADLALVPPKLNTSPLPEYDCDKLDYGMTIGIERTPGGRLWACWVAGGDSPKAFFVLATSDDDGETWSNHMYHHYGYIKMTESEADGDHIDVFIGPNPASTVVFVIDQSGSMKQYGKMIAARNGALGVFNEAINIGDRCYE